MRLEDLPAAARECVAAKLVERIREQRVGIPNSKETRKEEREMEFKKLRGVNRPYREQGLIRFTCMTYDQQPEEVRNKIKELCRICGGEYEEALFQMMTRENISVQWLEQKYFVSDSVLYERRKQFYERW